MVLHAPHTHHSRRPAVRKSNSVLPGAPSIFRRPLRHSGTGQGGVGAAAGSGASSSAAAGEAEDEGTARQAQANKLLRHKTVIRVRAQTCRRPHQTGGTRRPQCQQLEQQRGCTIATCTRAGAPQAAQTQARSAPCKHHTCACPVQYTSLDRTEASFPAATLRQANSRRLTARTRPNAYFNAEAAAEDTADAAGAYGHCQLPLKPLPARDLLRRHQAATGGGPAGGGKGDPLLGTAAGQPFAAGAGSFFITQRGTLAAGANGTAQQQAAASAGGAAGATLRANAADDAGAAAARASVSSDLAGAAAALAASASASQSAMGAGSCGACGFGENPGAAAEAAQEAAQFDAQPLTAPTRIEPGSRDPVPGWHNHYLQSRQAARGALQRDLWHRSKRRAAYRSSPKMAAALTTRVISDLDDAEGHLAPGWVPGACAGHRRAFSLLPTLLISRMRNLPVHFPARMRS